MGRIVCTNEFVSILRELLKYELKKDLQNNENSLFSLNF